VFVISEEKLWVGVIEQAFQDAVRPEKIKTRVGDIIDNKELNSITTAKVWLDSQSDDFRTVCSLAGLEPSWVARKWDEVKNNIKHHRNRWNKRFTNL
jgi:hypothetical protein